VTTDGPLVLYRWHVDTSANDPRVERRRIVDAALVPMVHDPAVRQGAECVYAGKYFPPHYPRHELQVTVLGQGSRGEQAAAAVERHLTGTRVRQRVGPDPGDHLCQDDCAWYRPRLTQVTRVALDLHGEARHAAALVGMWDPANNAALHAYLSRESPAYREVCDTAEAVAAFWADFWRPGPGPELSHPGHWIENLLGD